MERRLLLVPVILSYVRLVVSSSDPCSLSKNHEVAACSDQLERDLRNRRPDDSVDLQCCIFARLRDCLTESLQDTCQRQQEEMIKRSMKTANFTAKCRGVVYQSAYCYAYLYGDVLNIAMFTFLFCFTCFAIIACFRSFCRASHRYHVTYGLQPVEQRPLIVVTRRH